MSRYVPPTKTCVASLADATAGVREIPTRQRERLMLPGFDAAAVASGPVIHYAGDLMLIRQRCVAIVGSRHVSEDGAKRARRLARELVASRIVVMSGLAEGVDTEALQSAVEAGGRVVAVIGTPLDKAYPAKNKLLQERIYRDHLLVSPFPAGAPVFKSNFPQRNKVMAALSDATVIIEASDTSGSLHQAAECRPDRLNRWLFIARSVVDNPQLAWPRQFLHGPRVRVLERVDDILAVI